MIDGDVTMELRRCRRLLAASCDGFWDHDLRTGRLWTSEGFFRRFGLGLGPDGTAGHGRHLLTRLHPADRRRALRDCRAALAGGDAFDYELRLLDDSRQWRWIRGHARVWRDAEGHVESLSGSCTDVHREHLALRSLEAETRRLESQVVERTEGLAAALRAADERRIQADQANAAKTRYLAQLSHEIRTPLSAMLALAELSLRNARGADQHRYLELMLSSGQALQQLLAGVLDLARVEAGRYEARPVDFDLPDSLTAMLRALMPLAFTRGLDILYDHHGSEGPVHGDEAALRQIVTNLVGNAIKHTAGGLVRVVSQACVDAGGGTLLSLRVADDGPGIAAERHAAIFEPFVQGPTGAPGNGAGGAGMGLAIARGLARALGGDVTLHCPPEGGAVFTVTLPFAPARHTRAPAETPRRPGCAWIVQRKTQAGLWLGRRFERQGWQCVLHDTLADAVASAAHADLVPPDLVLLGGSAVGDGDDPHALRAALPDALMRLVIRPDWHASNFETLAQALDIVPLVVPYTPRQIRALGRAFADVGRTSEAARPAGAIGPSASADGTALPAVAGSDVLLVEDNAVNQLIGREFLQALGHRVRLASDGRGALAACAEHPPDLVLMDLHLPDMNGCAVTEQLNAMARDGQWPGAPIIALTAFATQDDQALCAAAGMSAMLTKPLSLDTLRRELQRWL